MKIFFIGPIGSDAGGWYIGPDGKIHKIPGWNPEGMFELAAAIRVIREAGQLKTPGLREATIKGALDFVQKEFGKHVTEGGIVVVGG